MQYAGLVFQSIPVRSEGEYKHIRLSDKPEAAKKKPQTVSQIFLSITIGQI